MTPFETRVPYMTKSDNREAGFLVSMQKSGKTPAALAVNFVLSAAAIEILDHARRVFASSAPQVDPWTRQPKPVLFAALAGKHSEAALKELVDAGYLAPAPGSAMWGYYIKGERL